MEDSILIDNLFTKLLKTKSYRKIMQIIIKLTQLSKNKTNKKYIIKLLKNNNTYRVMFRKSLDSIIHYGSGIGTSRVAPTTIYENPLSQAGTSSQANQNRPFVNPLFTSDSPIETLEKLGPPSKETMSILKEIMNSHDIEVYGKACKYLAENKRLLVFGNRKTNC